MSQWWTYHLRATQQWHLSDLVAWASSTKPPGHRALSSCCPRWIPHCQEPAFQTLLSFQTLQAFSASLHKQAHISSCGVQGCGTDPVHRSHSIDWLSCSPLIPQCPKGPSLFLLIPSPWVGPSECKNLSSPPDPLMSTSPIPPSLFFHPPSFPILPSHAGISSHPLRRPRFPLVLKRFSARIALRHSCYTCEGTWTPCTLTLPILTPPPKGLILNCHSAQAPPACSLLGQCHHKKGLLVVPSLSSWFWRPRNLWAPSASLSSVVVVV